jgi:hypothetical protein
VAADEASGNYNPVAAGAWNADALLKALKAQVEATPNAEMDAIMGLETAVRGYWEK